MIGSPLFTDPVASGESNPGVLDLTTSISENVCGFLPGREAPFHEHSNISIACTGFTCVGSPSPGALIPRERRARFRPVPAVISDTTSFMVYPPASGLNRAWRVAVSNAAANKELVCHCEVRSSKMDCGTLTGGYASGT